jgi:hypothetical protein
MKKLVVCCDGTWNSPSQEEYELPAPTNVLRIYNALARFDDNNVEQLKYYHPGVGTEGGFLSKTAGGLYGYGLSQNIMSAYAWLARHYELGDKIYIFGFSRGAFTARSLGGMLAHCGILDLRDTSDPFNENAPKPSDTWALVKEAFDAYRNPSKEGIWKTPRKRSAPPKVPIQFIGVWETVGALGIPDDKEIFNLLDRPKNWLFHDTKLSDETCYARHALAMDEMRSSFTPTLWTKNGEVYHDQLPLAGSGDVARVRQIYFPGVHSDVGGGYYECGLANGALLWMIEEVKSLPKNSGLAFVPAMVDQIKPDYQAPLHDSYRGLFKLMYTRPRNIPKFLEADRFHPSALARLASPPIFQSPYRPRVEKISPSNQSTLDYTLAVGGKAECRIYAINPWNSTGIYLVPGKYQFEAAGEWLDREIPSDSAGKTDDGFKVLELVRGLANFLSPLESLTRFITRNEKAEILLSKRIDYEPWFSLIGVVTNDCDKKGILPESPANDGTPPGHQTFVIGKNYTETISYGGFLYAFANDSWNAYENNRGSVVLRVKRLS